MSSTVQYTRGGRESVDTDWREVCKQYMRVLLETEGRTYVDLMVAPGVPISKEEKADMIFLEQELYAS